MRAFALLVMLLAMAAGFAARAADEDDPEPIAPDQKKLVGEWEMTGMKAKGIDLPVPIEQLKMTMTFRKDGTLTASSMGQDKKGKWKIDSKKSPRHLDLIDIDNPSKVIYKIEKDQLVIAAAIQERNARPKDFDSADAILTFKRKQK